MDDLIRLVDSSRQDWYTFFVNCKTCLILTAFICSPAAASARPAVVVDLATDVWSRPIAYPNEKPTDELRETQLLMGEKVIIHESSGSWLRIEAVEQPEYTHHQRWEGYPGWVWKDSLGPVGSAEEQFYPTAHIDVVTFAASMVGTPYLWGGLTRKGMDCSGLVHMAYRQSGLVVPRDSHEQWMKANPIKRNELKSGDLIFSAKAEDPKRIIHVALFAAKRQIIEAPQTGMVVRKISFQEKYGKPLDQVESGDKVGDRIIYFGRFLNNGPPAKSRGG